jgi:hypothetical protein
MRNAAYDLKKRGVIMRWITEITRENIPYCMEGTNFAELRHLGGIRASGCRYFSNPLTSDPTFFMILLNSFLTRYFVMNPDK